MWGFNSSCSVNEAPPPPPPPPPQICPAASCRVVDGLFAIELRHHRQRASHRHGDHTLDCNRPPLAVAKKGREQYQRPAAPGLVFPVTVTCGTMSPAAECLSTASPPRWLPNVPLNGSCTVNEVPKATTAADLLAGLVPRVVATYSPSSSVTIACAGHRHR